ncbi:MAG: hypothetical protein DWG76_00365 [Chloroflexi bacterium]|nr:hypothetical protein [Chloroflexota bacterium]
MRAYVWAVVLSFITLALLYSGQPDFGPINDMTTVAIGFVAAAIAWQAHEIVLEQRGASANIFLGAAIMGFLLIAGNSFMVAFGGLNWLVGGMYTALGVGFLGIWFSALGPTLGAVAKLPDGLVRLGRWTAWAMMLGLLGALPLLGLIQMNSGLAYAGMLGKLVGWLLFPWWAHKSAPHLSHALNQ